MTPTEALIPALPQPKEVLALSLAEVKTSRYLFLLERGSYVNCCLAVGGLHSLPWQVEGALGTAFSWQCEMTAGGPGNVTWARRSCVPSHLEEPCLGYFWVSQWPHTLWLPTSDPSP